MAGYTIGIEDLYFAPVTTDTKATIAYGTPVEIAKAVSATVSPKTATASFYANNKEVATVNEVTGIELKLSVDDLNAAALETVLGIQKNADGVIVFDDSAIAPYGALLFKSKLHNGGYRYVALLKGTFQLPEDSFQTKGEGVEFSAKEITGNFVLREHDGAYRYQVDSNDTGVSQTVIDGWFTSVYAPPAV
jgi:phi13 family phage major tail protein